MSQNTDMHAQVTDIMTRVKAEGHVAGAREMASLLMEISSLINRGLSAGLQLSQVMASMESGVSRAIDLLALPEAEPVDDKDRHRLTSFDPTRPAETNTVVALVNSGAATRVNDQVFNYIKDHPGCSREDLHDYFVNDALPARSTTIVNRALTQLSGNHPIRINCRDDGYYAIEAKANKG